MRLTIETEREEAPDKIPPDDLDRTTARAESGCFYQWFALGYTGIHCTPLYLCLSGKRRPRLDLAIDEKMPRVEFKR